MATPDITSLLPPSLNLPPHLSAHKYFFVCTLTVAAWDTLVLSPRTWKLFKTKDWPLLKIIFHFLRLFMPVEFTIVAVAFFDTKFTESQCSHFYLFEPICTAILVSLCSLVHLIRVNAIYDSNRIIQSVLGFFLGAQVVAMAVLCGFYRPMPLIFPRPPDNSGQGCIAGPKFDSREFVGIYWLIPTIFYTITFGLALTRSLQSLNDKQVSYWKLMLRDGLNLYGAIWIVNMVNMLFWFIATPTNNTDTIKTIVTSMTAVLTTTMTLRIILSIRGPLGNGGSFHGGSSTHGASHSNSRSAGTAPQILSNRSMGMGGVNSQHGPGVIAINPSRQPHSYGIGADGKEEARWADEDGKSQNSVPYKEGGLGGIAEDDHGPGLGDRNNGGNHGYGGNHGLSGVKVTIDRHVDDGGYAR